MANQTQFPVLTDEALARMEPEAREFLLSLRKQNELLEAEKDRLKAQAKRFSNLTVKVAEKGGVSVYGINTRVPVTLYGEQWVKLLDIADDIRTFIQANADKLAWKDATRKDETLKRLAVVKS